MFYVLVIGFLCTLSLETQSYPQNSAVISKYANVAVYGNNNTVSAPIRNDARTSKSENIWNHRPDPKGAQPTAKKKNPSVVYQYPVYEKPESKANKQQKMEYVPGIGEVIVAHQAQDRFEARPLFAYKKQIGSNTYLPPPPAPKPTSKPDLAPPSSGDPYNSPFSSYNPPNFKAEDPEASALYPPNGPPQIDDAPPSTEAPKKASLGPPLAPHDDDDYQPQDAHDEGHPEDPMAMYKQPEGPPPHPPKAIDDIYYPPDFPKDHIPDDGMKKEPAPSNGMDEAKGNSNGDDIYGGDMDDHGTAPLPPHDYGHGHAFPQYLYDHHHYDNHVYEEIPHTTMAPAKEDKRVSSTHYSYYYLGRKLWYIPLYFSIYFIIYVTVLIVKSIARHKVKLKYKWYDHSARDDHKGRSLDFDAVRRETLDNVHHNVTVALKNASRKYDDSVGAMRK